MKKARTTVGCSANDDDDDVDDGDCGGLFVFGARAPQWTMASSFTKVLDRTQRRTTVGRTPPDE